MQHEAVISRMETAVARLAEPPQTLAGPNRLGAVADWFKTRSISTRYFVIAMLTACVGGLDGLSGWEVSLFVFYAIPISAAVWFIDLNAGLLVSFACGVIWWFANRNENPYATEWGYSWAALNRLIYFIFVAIGVKAIRRRQEADAAQIRMLQEMRQLEKEIVAISEREQQRIGRDLHDGLCQQLAAIGCAAKALAVDLEAGEVGRDKDATRIETALRQSVIEARSLARGIFPVHVDGCGLAVALGDLARMTSQLTKARIEMEDCGDTQIASAEVSMHLYRIAQEALSNAVKHSGASTIRISLSVVDRIIRLAVEDDGCGMQSDQQTISSGMGLRTMTYRARAVGARLVVGSGGLRGTCVLIELPLPGEPSIVNT